MSDALQEAQELYQECLDALRDQRKQIEEDLAFSDPSGPEQWDADVKRQRENDPGGKRPCLVMDQTGQYVANVAGSVEQSPPGLHAIPVGGGADKKAAEQIDGRFRHIEYASRATQHYTRALTSAARAGVGYLIVRPEYVDRAMGYQEPRISCEPDPLKVVFDPWSVDTDGKDGTFGFVLTSMAPRAFAREFGKAEQRAFGDTERTMTDERKDVLVAEQWIKETRKQNVVIYLDENGQEASDDVEDDLWYEQAQASGLPLQYLRSYKDKREVVKWRRMSGAEILQESEYPADSIGIVPVYGYVAFKDGRMRYCGIPRRARNPQQAYNYHVSEQMAYIATAPKSPWIVPARALDGFKDIWDRGNVEQRAYLPYNDIDDSQTPIAAPQRTNAAMNLQQHYQGAEQALRDIQASIGMYQANLGAPSNEKSGIAIQERKSQGEASTAHFPSHMAASLTQVGRIVMQMDARLSDTKRQQPIIGVDGSAGMVTFDPEQQQAFKRSRDGVTINPAVGTYGVHVTVGASYSTQRTETNAAFTEIMRSAKDPALMAAVLPFWAQTLDFPGSEKFAQAMAAMAPAPVKAVLQPEGSEQEQDPAEVLQQLEQCKQALQEAIQVAQEADAEAAEAKSEAQALKADREIDQYKAETDRLKVTGANEQQVQAIVFDLVSQMLTPQQAVATDGPIPQAESMTEQQPQEPPL